MNHSLRAIARFARASENNLGACVQPREEAGRIGNGFARRWVWIGLRMIAQRHRR